MGEIIIESGSITGQMVRLVETAKIKAHVFYPYACAIAAHQSGRSRLVDFKPINQAILARWSMSALVEIKAAGWGIFESFSSTDRALWDGCMLHMGAVWTEIGGQP